MDAVIQKVKNNPFSDIFVLNLTLPMSFTLCAQPPSTFDRQCMTRLNNTLLDIVLSSVEPTIDAEDIDEVVLKQLRLMDAKVELALTWLSRLIADKHSLPPSQSIDINTIGIRFMSEMSVKIKDNLLIKLYIDPHLAEPITLQADVFLIEGHSIIANFSEMDLEVKDKIDKYIFREHRRCVAHKKLRPKLES